MELVKVVDTGGGLLRDTLDVCGDEFRVSFRPHTRIQAIDAPPRSSGYLSWMRAVRSPPSSRIMLSGWPSGKALRVCSMHLSSRIGVSRTVLCRETEVRDRRLTKHTPPRSRPSRQRRGRRWRRWQRQPGPGSRRSTGCETRVSYISAPEMGERQTYVARRPGDLGTESGEGLDEDGAAARSG